MSRFEKTVAALFATVALAALGGCAAENAEPVSASQNTCPAWVEHPADSHANQPSPYLGCVNALNRYNMLEDKADLKQGRELGPADGERASMAITNYEQDKVKKSSDTEASHAIFAPIVTGTSSEGQ